MAKFSDNYYLRKCFLEREQVPTISLMKKKMTPALADVYFKSMTPHLKVIAGLEPPLMGGGNDWFVPPDELLKGRAVLKPVDRKFMKQWHWNGIDEIGMKLIQAHRDRMLSEGQRVIAENDLSWPLKVREENLEEWTKCAVAAKDANTQYLRHAIRKFEVLYTSSITKLQDLLFDAAINNIKSCREAQFKQMQSLYEHLLRQQAIMLYEKYIKKITKAKAKLKNKFLNELRESRIALHTKLHDINVDKHVTVEKLRHLLECQTLACQVYVAMREQQECSKEMEDTINVHNKKTTNLTECMINQEFEILLAQEKAIKHIEHETIWKKKVCHIVKTFQMFVSYCLSMLPAYADFFINVEKLMLLQLGDAFEFHSVRSIIIIDNEPFHTPIPRPHPFYLFCEKNNRPYIDQNLCPKHCTSSASQMPVVVINKRCIYSACDNFEQFSDRVKDYVFGNLENDAATEDHHDYTRDVPVKSTDSQQKQELKLESSLFQILQQDKVNIRDMPIKCRYCRLPYCFCDDRSLSPQSDEIPSHSKQIHIKRPSMELVQLGKKIPKGQAELKYEREPKWESYAKYVESKKCDCAKKAKKHLLENLPIYMRQMSTFEEPELLNYEKCSVVALRALMKEVREKETPSPTKVASKTKEISTQCSELFEHLCPCVSKDGVLDFIKSISDIASILTELLSTEVQFNQFNVVGDTLSSSFLNKRKESFAAERVLSLKHLIEQSPDIEEIFRRTDCIFD